MGDAFWLDQSAWRDFCEYEMELSQSLAGRPMSVLCAYPLAVIGATDILDVARAHQCAVAKRNQDWKVVETPALRQAKEEIARLNEELEQRVIERTRQLTTVNQEVLREVIAERNITEAALQQAQADLARGSPGDDDGRDGGSDCPMRPTNLSQQSLPKGNPACAGLHPPRPISTRFGRPSIAWSAKQTGRAMSSDVSGPC